MDLNSSFPELSQALLGAIKNYSAEDSDVIIKAFNKACSEYAGRTRQNGDSLLSHTVAVAIMLAERNFDAKTLAASLLHEISDFQNYDYGQIFKLFGKDITEIITLYKDASSIPIRNKPLFFSSENYLFERVDNYRKLLLSTAKSASVIIIKLFDRLHNLMTMDAIDTEKQRFYAIETIEIYAAIAERLGLAEVKRQLEDLSFPYAYPDDYQKFRSIITNLLKIDQKFIGKKVAEISSELMNNNLQVVEIQSRIKHQYSIFRKLKDSYDFDLSRFNDLYALRIITNSVSECYRILGIIHSKYVPIRGRIFDMIAEPKANGYQSLHTTLSDTSGKIFEVQIRTIEMHQIAEYGPAAHWNYKESGDRQNKIIDKSRQEWLRELKNIKNIDGRKELLGYIKNDLFSKKIFAFTPNGDIFELPTGSCVIDFAFRIHSRLGESCAGARINGTIANINTQIKNGDVIEIITSKRAKPSIDWLEFTKTSAARQKIKKYLRLQDFDRHLVSGRSIFLDARLKYELAPLTDKTMIKKLKESRLPYNDLDDLYVALANKIVTPIMALKVFYPGLKVENESKQTKLIPSSPKNIFKGIPCVSAKCCNPKIQDKTIGYVGRDHIIKIHKIKCKMLKNVDTQRLICLDPFDSAS